jgi:biopolymer transport protein ExbB
MNESGWFVLARRMGRSVVWQVLCALALWGAATRAGVAQESAPVDPDQLAAEKLAAPADEETVYESAESAEVATPEFPSMLEMFFAGGILMWPILLMSFVVVVFGCERLIALRRRRVIPPRLVRQLTEWSARPGGVDPKAALRLCQQFPSTTSNVLKSVLPKLDRPHSEVEAILKDASDREANRLFNNVRPINLAATVAPLLGLLGTVQGMIYSFFVTANLPTTVNKAQHLAEGIYIALVTTFAGLTVAIPAVMIAHYFEGRIQRLFRDIDELLLGLLPHLERFESKQRPPADPERERAPLRRPPVEHAPVSVPAAKE